MTLSAQNKSVLIDGISVHFKNFANSTFGHAYIKAYRNDPISLFLGKDFTKFEEAILGYEKIHGHVKTLEELFEVSSLILDTILAHAMNIHGLDKSQLQAEVGTIRRNMKNQISLYMASLWTNINPGSLEGNYHNTRCNKYHEVERSKMPWTHTSCNV